jgi:hypothetical protein
MTGLFARSFGEQPTPADLSFFVSCVPPKVGHHHKQIVKKGAFHSLADKPELVAARQSWLSMIQPFRPPAPILGAVSLFTRCAPVRRPGPR